MLTRYRTGAVDRTIALLSFLLTLSVSGCSGDGDDGLEKYPVHGSVLVNGEPAEGLVVTFLNLDSSARGNAARPVAVTDREGRFALSTNGESDGAVAGQYVATFFWPTDTGPMPADRLAGQFSDPAHSPYRPRIEPNPNTLDPFRIEIDPKRLKPSSDSSRPSTPPVLR